MAPAHFIKEDPCVAVKRALLLIVGLCCGLNLVDVCAEVSLPEAEARLVEVHRSRLAYPVLPGLGIDDAYRLQQVLVRDAVERGQRVVAFKGGLTAAGSAAKYGVSEPIVGALLSAGQLAPGAVLQLADYRRLGMELEVGFVFGERIDAPVDMAGLRRRVRGFVPAVELPDLGFSAAAFTGIDLVANNAAARSFIFGPEQAAEGLDPNQIQVRLLQGEAEINQGRARDAMGDQWQAALWLTNELLRRGYVIEPGQVLITGVLGKLMPGAVGRYTAEYGELGQLRYEVK